MPSDASKFAMYRASQKKLSGVPGGAIDGAPGVGGVCSPCGGPLASGGGSCGSGSPCGRGRLSLRIYSTVLSKNTAISLNRISSGVRLPFSHGDHCCGDTSNSSAHFFEPPRPGYFFILQSRIFHAIISRNSSGILPMLLNLSSDFAVLSSQEKERERRLVARRRSTTTHADTTDHRSQSGVHREHSVCMVFAHTIMSKCRSLRLIVCIVDECYSIGVISLVNYSFPYSRILRASMANYIIASRLMSCKA